jgi:hypothetical protein
MEHVPIPIPALSIFKITKIHLRAEGISQQYVGVTKQLSRQFLSLVLKNGAHSRAIGQAENGLSRVLFLTQLLNICQYPKMFGNAFPLSRLI